MAKRLAGGWSPLFMAAVLATGLLGGLVAAAGPADAQAFLYAAPAAAGTGDCSSAANACTLQAALADAAAGDTVYLVQPGNESDRSTYYIGNWDVTTSGTSSSAQVTIAPAPGVLGRPILDGDNGGNVGCETSTCGGSVFTIHDNVHATVEGVTIQHTVSGGINNVNGATLTVSGSTFYSNVNANGGAIDNGGDQNYLAGGTLTVADSTFTSNNAGGNGGAIYDGPRGTATLTVADSTFTGNVAGPGDGVSAGAGGAIDNLGAGPVTVADSTFAGNTATHGGAIDTGDFIGTGPVTVSDSTFTGNSAGADGGAIDNGDNGNGTLTVADSTFTGNTASTHGATIDNSDNFGSGTVSVTADIFNGGCDQAGGSWEDAGYNVGSDASCENGGTSDSAALTPGELGPLASNGGPTQTVRPLKGNPALGIVPPATSVSLGGSSVKICPVTDQRGDPSALHGLCDAGAVQARTKFPVITQVAPAAGPVTGGTVITIRGRNFTAGARVVLGQGPSPGAGAIAASVDMISWKKIIATTGPGRPGVWNVFVVTTGGLSIATVVDHFRYQ